MELILLQQVSQLGEPGDLVDVKSGYGRNFLIPSGKAIRADENNKAEYEAKKSALLSAESDRKEIASKLAKQLEEIKNFVKVMPHDYKRVLEQATANNNDNNKNDNVKVA